MIYLSDIKDLSIKVANLEKKVNVLDKKFDELYYTVFKEDIDRKRRLVDDEYEYKEYKEKAKSDTVLFFE